MQIANFNFYWEVVKLLMSDIFDSFLCYVEV